MGVWEVSLGVKIGLKKEPRYEQKVGSTKKEMKDLLGGGGNFSFSSIGSDRVIESYFVIQVFTLIMLLIFVG